MHLTIRLMDNHWHTAYTQVNLRQAMNTREGQSHISCVPSRPNQLHPQVQPPLTFVIRRCIGRSSSSMSAYLARHSYEHKENLSEPPSSRVVCLYHCLHRLDLATTGTSSHIVRSSHCSCQSVHCLISATLFVSIPSSSRSA